MDQQEIRENLVENYGLTGEEVDYFFTIAEFQKVKKNQVLVEQFKDESFMVLIANGCLMTYFADKENFTHVLQFGIDMWWTGDLEGFINHSPSNYSVRAIVESEIYILSHESFILLTERFPGFEKYFRILFQKSLISHQKRILRNISYTAEEKYQAFRKDYAKMELIVPQKYIASYLGITPEFLSKIRGKMTRNA